MRLFLHAHVHVLSITALLQCCLLVNAEATARSILVPLEDVHAPIPVPVQALEVHGHELQLESAFNVHDDSHHLNMDTMDTRTRTRTRMNHDGDNENDSDIHTSDNNVNVNSNSITVTVTNATNTTTAAPSASPSAAPGNHTNVTTTAPSMAPTSYHNHTNTTTLAPTITPGNHNHTNTTNTTAPTKSPTSAPVPVPAPTLPPKKPTNSPTAAPHKKYDPSDDDNDDDKHKKKKKKKSFLHQFFSFIGWMVLIGISILTFGFCMQNRTQIYFFLLGLMHTLKEACETFAFRMSLICASVGRSIRNLHIMDRIYDLWGRIRGLGGSSGRTRNNNRSRFGNDEDGSMLQGLLLRENA